ncbi:unknown protein [Seminavis robusta]|uniref:Uncharacterized protein n=1 Tax=Seminavis robusta TaxID=568900 RepID=A0A9N8DS43_9STRA|nr:unknown protein [Seminavis robusta]|eukprot:Sro301_g112050.1 n/a (261) ;mRNA; r:63667-64449
MLTVNTTNMMRAALRATIGLVGRLVGRICMTIVQFWFVATGQLLFHFSPDELNRIVVSYCRDHNLFEALDYYYDQPMHEHPSVPSPLPSISFQPPPPSWEPVRDVDGHILSELCGVSCRFKYQFRAGIDHVQGILKLERYGSSPLHRVWIQGNWSLPGPSGQKRVKGPAFDYPIQLPIGCHYTLEDTLGQSERSRRKHFLLKLAFTDNDDGLEYMQCFVPVGQSPEKLSGCLAFHQTLVKGLDCGCEEGLDAEKETENGE